MNNWPKRLYSLDIARGIASLAVILWHWQSFSFNGTEIVSDFSKETQPFYSFLRMFYEKGGKGVDFFFLLSGFVFFWLYHESIKNRSIGLKEFIVARFSRLYPLHFITLLLVAGFQGIFWIKEQQYFVYPCNDAYHFILHLFLVNHWGFQKGWAFNAPVWSVSIEVLLYIVFFIVSVKRLGNLYFCLAVCFISFVVTHTLKNNIFLGLTSFFLGGAIFHAINLFIIKSRRLQRIIYGICITSWIGVIVNYYFYNIVEQLEGLEFLGKLALGVFPVYILFSSTVCSIALIEINASVKRHELKVLKSLSWLGDISYSSYLLHFPLQAIFGLAITFDLLERDFFLSPFWLIFFLLVTILISYICFVKFEKKAQATIRSYFSKKPQMTSPVTLSFPQFRPVALGSNILTVPNPINTPVNYPPVPSPALKGLNSQEVVNLQGKMKYSPAPSREEVLAELENHINKKPSALIQH